MKLSSSPMNLFHPLFRFPGKNPTRLLFPALLQLNLNHQLSSFPKEKSEDLIDSICNSFRKGCNWDALKQKFDCLALNDSMVRDVILRLKEPGDARCALGFFHWAAKAKSFDHGVDLYCTVVHILVNAQLIRDAQVLIESVLRRTADGSESKMSVVDSLLGSYVVLSSRPVVFDLLVQGYAKLRMAEAGFEVSCYLEDRGFHVSLTSYNSLLHVVQKSDRFGGLVWRIYEHMIAKRIYPNEACVRIMISALSKEGQLQKSLDFLDRVHGKRCTPSVIVNATLVYRVLEEGRITDALALLKRMLQRNMVFDTVAYSLTICAKLKSGDIDAAWEIHEEMIRRGFDANSFVYTAFIGAYCRDGRIEESDRLVREMEDLGLSPYEETYNLLIEGWTTVGRPHESLRFCRRMMERGLLPTLSAFNKLVKKLSEIGEVKLANEIFTVLLDRGFNADEVTYSLMMSGYGKIGEGEEVLKLYYEMGHKGLPRTSVVLSSFIECLSQSGKHDEAEKYLRSLNDCSAA